MAKTDFQSARPDANGNLSREQANIAFRDKYGFDMPDQLASQFVGKVGGNDTHFYDRVQRGDFEGEFNAHPEWKEQAATQALIDDISAEINALEDELQSLPSVEITEEEFEIFLQKAIEETKPYFDKKRAEIEAGIKEGKIRTAEEMLMTLRDVKEEIADALKGLDIRRAQTEEEFINMMADITSSKEEDIALKREDWRNRIESAREGLIQSGTLTSGIGRKQLEELAERQRMEEEALKRSYEQKQTDVETKKKYTLEQIALARQQAEAERLNRIGTPEEQAAAEARIRETLGIPEGEELPSDIELAEMRQERGQPLHTKEQLTALDEEQKVKAEAVAEAKRQREEDIRQKQYQAQYDVIEKERARKARELEQLRNYNF